MMLHLRCRGGLRPQSHPRRKFCIRAKQTVASKRRQPRKENIKGDFFVDHVCIDCDACRWLSPKVFARVNHQAAVTKQPENAMERRASLQALLSCPTSSIHVNKVENGELKEVGETFPIPLTQPDIFFCGFTDEKTFGAYSYLIRSPNGNVLVDCPRYTPALVRRFDEMGGVKYIFLTHIDDVGDHEKWAARYNALRLIHHEEVVEKVKDCEIQLEGSGPWTVGENGDLDEMMLIHTPGHTAGSTTLYHKPSRSMFTGDHFGYSEKTGGLTILARFNKHSVSVQFESLRKLLDYDFVNVYPGHGHRLEFKTVEERNKDIFAFLDDPH